MHCVLQDELYHMPEPNSIRLSQLAAQVEQVLKNAFDNMQFWVIADVTNHNQKSGTSYHYFELVEKAQGSNQLLAKFSAKAWGDGAREIGVFESRTGQKFTNNIQVLVRVKVQYHATYGIQLDLTGIDTSFTLGVLEQQRMLTLERLCRENPQFIKKRGEEYWTSNKALSLPLVIQKIAVVCGTGSAGWQDFQHTIENNPHKYKFDLSPFFTNVQGDANAAAMRAKMIEIFQSPVKFDLVVIIRGGGAQTDFLIFDHYLVGQAIARFPIPVMTGIGHQKNTTIADLMAHTSVKTPTEAAGIIINHNRAFHERLINIQQNLIIKAQQFLAGHNIQLSGSKAQITQAGYKLISSEKQQLNNIRQSIIGNGREIPYYRRTALSHAVNALLTYPKITIAFRKGELVNTIANIKANQTAFIKNSRGQIVHFKAIFDAVSPEKTLRRGFAMVKYQNSVISDPSELKKGDDFSVVMKDTELMVQLKDKKHYDGI